MGREESVSHLNNASNDIELAKLSVSFQKDREARNRINRAKRELTRAKQELPSGTKSMEKLK